MRRETADNPELVVIGAGGHAKVVIEVVEEQDIFKIVGTVSKDHVSSTVLGYPNLGDDSILPSFLADGVRHAVVAVGDNSVRRKITEGLTAIGFRLVNAIHPSAVISRRASLGHGVVIMAGTVVQSGALIGDGAILNTGATIDHDCVIGPFVHLAPGVNLAGGVQVGEGVFAGVGAKVIPGIHIGSWSVVGAGSVVVRNVPERATVTGVPARLRPE